ncbi:MAG TPA: YceD family protein [Rhodocyclaceae bacterium]|nr:YceD family protein [Rhodocyclaceae bacterium]
MDIVVSRSLVGLVVDTLEFAREGRSVSGTVPLSALPRLSEWIGEGSATLACELQGRREDGRNWLSLSLRGEFDLICQRCLGAMPFVLETDAELQVIAPGEPWPDEALEDGAISLGADAIAADTAQAVTDLIEEEVLLALPSAPKHEEGCEPPARSDDKRAASPFAVLATLKKH